MLFNSCLIFDGVVGSAEYALETEVGKQADLNLTCFIQKGIRTGSQLLTRPTLWVHFNDCGNEAFSFHNYLWF